MDKECPFHIRTRVRCPSLMDHRCSLHHNTHQLAHGLHQATNRNSRWRHRCQCSNHNNIPLETRPQCQRKPFNILMASYRRLLIPKIQSPSTQYPALSTAMPSTLKPSRSSQEAVYEEDSYSSLLDRIIRRHRCSTMAWPGIWGSHHHRRRLWDIICHDRARIRRSRRRFMRRRIWGSGR